MSTTLFKEVSYALASLMDDIELGEIGLPDIQRPFVWKNSKVRDLFDSMYRGYPVGYLLFWENQLGRGVKQIGTNNHQKVPNLLIVDGQQRMTSLYAVIKGIPVIRENYASEHIEIAFRPLDGKFEVADAAIKRNPEYLPNISELFSKDASQYSIIGSYIERLKHVRAEDGRELTPQEIKQSEQALQRLFSLTSFPFTALQLSASIDEEQVAEVFVRINSQGKTLNQADFILTLMSVFWEEGRKQLEDFCRAARKPTRSEASPFNYFVEPDPDQLLRVSVSLGFRRARLKYAYALLRGKDLETGTFSEEQRDRQFATLMDAQRHTLNLQHWHDFLGVMQQAGFRGGNMISSALTLYYTYTFYLIGRILYEIPVHTLNVAIGRWFFMSALTSRYTGSPESVMERDLADMRGLKTGQSFIDWMDRVIAGEFTEDFWKVTLPNRLETSSATSPLLFAYYAALNLLESKALFSRQKIWNALDPALKGKRKAVERHHLFPRKFLADLGIKQTREVNQIANYALVEWNDNVAIADSSPADYFPAYCQRLTPVELEKLCYWHALPASWEHMRYQEFLQQRRVLIAGVIRDGFARLTHGEMLKDTRPTLNDLIAAGEGEHAEFKSTLRVNLHTGEPDPRMEHAILKTIVGFLNSRKGGTLVVGVNDSGEAIGLGNDKFPNEDKMDLHLGNLIKSRLGTGTMLHISPRFEEVQGNRVMAVECRPSQVPVYLKNGKDEEFYVRAGASSAALRASQMTDYIRQRFG